MAVGDIYELAHRIIYASVQSTWNVFHFQDVTGAGNADNLATSWENDVMRAVWMPQLSVDMTCNLIRVRGLIPDTTTIAEHHIDIDGSTLFESGLHPTLAAILTWRTGIPGRQYRGRSYIAGLPSSMANRGELTEPGLNRITAIGNTILSRYTGLGVSTFHLGVWSRVRGGTLPPRNPDGFRFITSYTPQRVLGSMGTRRRVITG